MTDEQALEILKEPEKVIDPRICNELTSHLSAWISDIEEEIHERNLQVSVKWGELKKALKSIAETDRAIELEPVYQDREKAKLKYSQLRRLRADMKDRFTVLTNTKYR
jgi:hypothetical protein